jgi:hypothetical protein
MDPVLRTQGQPTTEQLVADVQAYAQEHYETNGWDLVVETMTKAEIEKLIAGAKTKLGALRKVSAHIAPQAAYRADVRGA